MIINLGFKKLLLTEYIIVQINVFVQFKKDTIKIC